MYSAMRRVSGTCTAHFVMGRISATWSMSWSEPMSQSSLGPGAADDDHGDAGALRVGHGRDDVGDAGPGGDGAHARLARDARPAVGGVAGGLLVADVDDADPLVEAAVVDGLDVASAEGEEVRRAVPLERLGDQAPAVDHCHVAPGYGLRASGRPEAVARATKPAHNTLPP